MYTILSACNHWTYSTKSIHKGHALSESCLTFSPKHVRRSAQSFSLRQEWSWEDWQKNKRKQDINMHISKTSSQYQVLSTCTYTMTSTHNLSSTGSWTVCMPEGLWWMDKGSFRRTGCEYEKGLCPTQRSRSHACSSALECTELDKSPATDTAC